MKQSFQVIAGKRTAERYEERARLHESSTFEEALFAHLDGLFAFALRLVGGYRADAEDLVQEVCLRAFKNYESLRSKDKIKPWLFQILVNTHINDYHRQSKELLIADIELGDARLDSADMEAANTPEELVFERLLDSEVQQALDALPIEFRTVVWLSDVEELDYKEIAEIMRCPLGTVASRLYRGHRLLRERLGEYARQRRLLKE